LVIFTSDNGPWLTQGKEGGSAGPLRGGKGGTFEGGMREPTIVWWPGHVPSGAASDAMAGNIDVLPTFVKLAGGKIPDDRKIDGADLSQVLLGQTKDSPRQVHYYFNGNKVEAVRSGAWKLAIAPQDERKYKPKNKDEKPAKKDEKQPFRPKLYNLDTDLGETTDVSQQHPGIVKRLQELVARMDADLGATKKGPGVRPPGRVAKPQPLLLPK
jgi:arylsulfatase